MAYGSLETELTAILSEFWPNEKPYPQVLNISTASSDLCYILDISFFITTDILKIYGGCLKREHEAHYKLMKHKISKPFVVEATVSQL